MSDCNCWRVIWCECLEWKTRKLGIISLMMQTWESLLCVCQILQIHRIIKIYPKFWEHNFFEFVNFVTGSPVIVYNVDVNQKASGFKWIINLLSLTIKAISYVTSIKLFTFSRLHVFCTSMILMCKEDSIRFVHSVEYLFKMLATVSCCMFNDVLLNINSMTTDSMYM